MDDVILARHGLAVSNRHGIASCAVPGAGLELEGVEQARALGTQLGGLDISLAATTELARAHETLALALAGRDVPVVVSPELNEIGFGSFDGGSLEAYRAWAAAQPPDERAPGGGESRAEAAARFARGLRDVLARAEGTILIVGHALMLRYVLDAGAGLVPAARMAPVEHARPYVLDREHAERAAALLDEWSCAPAFRDPSNEGRVRDVDVRPPAW